MKTNILRFICALICIAPLAVSAQINGEIVSSHKLYKEGKEMYLQGNYAAALPYLLDFVKQKPDAGLQQEAEYMLISCKYELKDKQVINLMNDYLDKYPDSPHANRIYALIASALFFDGKYDEALAMFNASDVTMLSDDERDDMTYRIALSYVETGNIGNASRWFETLRNGTSKYDKDAGYYLSYLLYTQQQYDEALSGFLPLQDDEKYRSLVPYYIAEIYLLKRHYDKAEIVAQNYLSNYPGNQHEAEMYRILGETYYYYKQYPKAITAFENYMSKGSEPSRAAGYMLGLSYYQTAVYSKAADMLGKVVTKEDALTQNAYLHLGLSYLQLADKTKARMAFQQAAASNNNMEIKEQAAYNYALLIHETSFSAFGESVTVFERFLNDFPNSRYAEKISSYLVDVYMTTRSYEAALKSIERISRPSTRILEAKQKILFHLGTQAFVNTSFEQAIGYFNQSVSMGQYNLQTKADALYWRGESYYRLGRMQEASVNFSEYLQLTQQKNTEMYALAHYNLGYTYFHQKNYQQARSWLERYIKLPKEENKLMMADAYNRVGDTYFQVRHFDEAKRYYALAEALDTQAGDYSFYQLALVSGLQKDYAGKVTLLNRLIGKYPSSPYIINAQYEKGRSYVLMNNNRQAITVFSELVEKYPENPLSRKAAAEIGLLYYQDGKHNEAIAAYKNVIERYPGSEEARLALADLRSIYIDINRVDEFAQLLTALPGNNRLEVTEQDSLTYVAAEKIYMRGRPQEAKESLERYLQNYPEGGFSLNAHFYLTKIAMEQKNYDQLLLHSGKLLEYPDSPFTEETLVMRGEVQYNRGQYADALVTYKKLREKATTAERRLMGQTGALRSAFLSDNYPELITVANDLLAETKLTPELTNEATYYRAKAYLAQNNPQAAQADLKKLAKDTRNLYGAEAKYLVAQQLYDTGKYEEAEKELLNFIDQSTPHAYWLARGFILLSDVYVAMDRDLDARQYLLSLQQNYDADDNINAMIQSRLKKLNKE